MAETTKPSTFFDKIIKNFPWGTITFVHEIDEYIVIEYHPKKFKDGIGTNELDMATTRFHSYINGKSTSRSYPSLDQAIIGAICIKHEGLNTQAPFYISKMLGLDTDDQKQS